MFSYIKSINDVDTKQRIGFIKVSSSANSYIDLLDQMDVGQYSSLCIVDSSGKVIYNHTPSTYLTQFSQFNDIYKNIKGQRQVLSVPINDTTLSLKFITSQREFWGSQMITYGMVFFVIFISFLISFLIYQHKAKKIAQTIYSIKDALGRVAKGDFRPIEISAEELELNEIIVSTNQMITKLKKYITKEYKLNMMQQEAEYRALQAQINPHFLYNTLNGFIALNRMGDKKLLENSIIDLTHLFQYTCNSSTTVYLEEEISFVKQYLDLQMLKYEERLIYHITIDPEINHVKIPKLLLQPLVENSIIHGLEPTDRPITIEVIGTTVTNYFGHYILIMVSDNGVGFSMTDFDVRKRIGINNICKRIKYKNPKNLCHIESTLGQGTRCIILLKI